MKRTIGFLVGLVILSAFPARGAEAPHEIAGLRLDATISQCKDRLNMESVLPIWDMEFLSGVEIKPPEGFKSGYILFGNCEDPGKIVRIKLKYARDDKEFFEQLLNALKQKYGEPTQYKGDAFRIFIAWKWAFTDKDHNKISLILQHNSDEEEGGLDGNSIKLSLTNLIEKERECQDRKSPSPKSRSNPAPGSAPSGQMDLKGLLPQ